MKLSYLYEFFLFVILVLLQVLLLNRISILGIATPILYSYFLLKLPIGRNLFFVIISGFLLGFIIDIFLNTPGMNAAATTIVATLRQPIINMIFPRDEHEEYIPGIHSGSSLFIKFALVVVLLHQTLLFFIESFTFFNLINTLLRITVSSVLTLVIILGLDSFMYRKKSSEQSK